MEYCKNGSLYKVMRTLIDRREFFDEEQVCINATVSL